MSTQELEIHKVRLARKILNEKNKDVIISLENNMRIIKRRTTAARNNKQKLADDFMQFVDSVRKPVANYSFNREECYD
jgi:hypothetical protein